jgi:hypothetical protein
VTIRFGLREKTTASYAESSKRRLATVMILRKQPREKQDENSKKK